MKKIILSSIILAFCFSLYACSNESVEEESITETKLVLENQEEYAYVPEYFDLQVATDETIVEVLMAESGMYYVVESKDLSFTSSKMCYFDFTNRELQSFSFEKSILNSTVIDLCMEEDGNVGILEVQVAEEELESYGVGIQIFDPLGTQLASYDVTEIVNSYHYFKGSSPDFTMLLTKDKILLENHSDLIVLNQQLEVEYVVEVPGYLNSMELGTSDKIFFLVRNMELYRYELNLETGEFIEETELSRVQESNGDLVWMDPGATLVYDNSKCFYYDVTTDSSIEVLQWGDSNLIGKYIEAVRWIDDTTLVGYLDSEGEHSLVYLNRTARDEIVTETITLTLASLWGGVENDVTLFNQKNQQYQIELIEYFDGDLVYDDWEVREVEFEAAKTRFLLDIVKEDGPDMVAVDDATLALLIEHDLVVDLFPLMETTDYKESDFVEPVIEALKINDALYYLPKEFSVLTRFANASVLGLEMGWTIEEFLERVPEGEPMLHGTKDLVFDILMRQNYEYFIESESGRAKFDSAEFKHILEYANTFPLEQESDGEYIPEALLFKEEERLLYTQYISDLSQFSNIMTCLGENGVTMVGSPNPARALGELMLINNKVVIHSSSKYPEVAADFIIGRVEEYNASEIYELSILAKEYDAENTQYIEEGFATTEMLEMFEKLIASSVPQRYHVDEVVGAILEEEVAAYFAGQKSVEEVMEIIQNRVELYLQENY